MPEFTDSRGSLSFIEANNHIPFQINRAYYLYDIPMGQKRGAHAHKELHQLIIAVSGSFEITLHNGESSSSFCLSSPSQGLYVPPMIWRDLSNFSKHAVCMVFASEFFSEEDYIMDFSSYLQLTGELI